MRRLEVVQIGLGHVGRAVAQMILEERKRWLEEDDLLVSYAAVSDTSGALVGEDSAAAGDPVERRRSASSRNLGAEPLGDVLRSRRRSPARHAWSWTSRSTAVRSIWT